MNQTSEGAFESGGSSAQLYGKSSSVARKGRLWRSEAIDRRVAAVSLLAVGASLSFFSHLSQTHPTDAADLLACLVAGIDFSALFGGFNVTSGFLSGELASGTWAPLAVSGIAAAVVVAERVRAGLKALAGLWLLPLPLWALAAWSSHPAVALLGLTALPCVLIGLLLGLGCEPDSRTSERTGLGGVLLLLVTTLAAAGALVHFGGTMILNLTPFAVCRPLLGGHPGAGLAILAHHMLLAWGLVFFTSRMAAANVKKWMTDVQPSTR